MNEYQKAYPLFFHPGEVVEIRAFGLRGKNNLWDGHAGGKGVVMGYFNDPEKFARAAENLDALQHNGVYHTLNPVKPDLIARAVNRLVAADDKRPSTSDKDTAVIRWLPLDFDPARPSGISATDAELHAAIACASAAAGLLEGEMGFPRGIRAASGNGVHLLYRLPDFPPGDEISGTQGLTARAIRALGSLLGPDHPGVIVDSKVFNPARIWKYYGTWARKGDSTVLRPHRKSTLWEGQVTTLSDIGILTQELLEGLAALSPTNEQQPVTKTSHEAGWEPSGQRLGPMNLDRYLAHFGREVLRVKEDSTGRRYILRECVFDSGHRGGEASVHQGRGGLLSYQCYHDSCKGRTWADARRIISGDEGLARFCEGYDPNWRKPDKATKKKCTALPSTGTTPPATHGEAWMGQLLTTDSLIEQGIEVVAGNTLIVPHPHDANPIEFFEQVSTKNGTREHFSGLRMVMYLQAYLQPMRCVGGVYWRYMNGVWREFPDEEIGKVVLRALKGRVRREFVEQSLKLFGYHIAMEEKHWKAPEWSVNLANGMLNLSRGGHELVAHKPEYWSRSQLPVGWDESAECAEWISALEGIFHEPDGVGEAKRRLLQEFFGYVLLPTCRYEKAMFLYGSGANGKTTILNVLDWIVGAENMSALSMEGLSRDFNLPYLIGKMVNIATEVESRESVGTENFKRCVSGDPIEGEWKHGKRITFRNLAKFIFAMNRAPAISDKSYGFQRKVIVINCGRRFSEEEKDVTLGDRLRQELPGILRWAVVGAMRLLTNGRFSETLEIRRDGARLMAQMNPLLNFVAEVGVMQRDLFWKRDDCYRAYVEYCGQNGYKPFAKGNFLNEILSTFTTIRDGRREMSETDGAGGTKTVRARVFLGIGPAALYGDLPIALRDENLLVTEEQG